MKKRLISLTLLAVTLLLPGLCLAFEQEEPTTYVIKKGDTLWGLTERFIKDPKYWPNMWANNSQITNPHFVYPGQTVRIFQDRIEIVPASTQKAAAIKAEIVESVAEERSFTVHGSEGYLMETDSKPFGYVIGAYNNRISTGVDDIVYTNIGTQNGAKGGERFSIYRREGEISHPISNEIMGRKMIPLGILQLTDVNDKSSRAIITKNYKEISVGSYLYPYKNGLRHDISLKMPNRELRGYIIESYRGTQVIAAGDIVYIDLGAKQGAEAGNMLYIVRDVKLDRRVTEGRSNNLPQELLGALVILEAGQTTSTALVVKSIDALYKGDKIISQTK